MADQSEVKARKAVRRAQSDFERAQDKLEGLCQARRESFEQASASSASRRCTASPKRPAATRQWSATFTDTGMRLGEVLPLRREDFDGETLQVRRTAHEGPILEGTKTDHGEHDAGRVVPVPATLAWMLEAQINLNGPDCRAPLHDPDWPPLARAHLLPRRLEADPGSLRPGHPPPRVPPLLRHPPPRCRHQRRRPSRDRGPSGRDDAGAIYARGPRKLRADSRNRRRVIPKAGRLLKWREELLLRRTPAGRRHTASQSLRPSPA